MVRHSNSDLVGRPESGLPMVMIGVPTHNRPVLLARTLNCIANQDYPNIKVVVADNCSSGVQTEQTVDSFRKRIANLEYTRHEVNIGSLNNFFWLLEQADGDFFMWLADDDEISENYVSSLAKLLISDASISTAAGHWVSMKDKDTAVQMETSSFAQRHSLLRCMRYAWATDDAFFYGLHRTNWLKNASFPGFFWPNREVLINWAYVFLFDMVIQGRIVMANDPTVQFINHDYTVKQYIPTKSNRIPLVSHISRRCNVHFLYWSKARRSIGTTASFALALVSFLALTKECVFMFKAHIFIAFKKMIRPQGKQIAREV